jgi:phenylalanyl-tRNA synthetase beta chain
LRTESSARFEKGLDPNNAILALNRACELVSILGAGEIVGGFIDINNSKKEPLKFPLESKWINEFLATDLTEQEMVKILQKLDIAVDDNKMVTIPSFRGDLEHKADIAEEIARIYGYNNIATTMFKGTVTGGLLTSVQKTRKIIDETLLGCGLNEICTYSFISPKYLDKILVAEDSVLRNTVTIKNPLGEDTSIMRTTPLPSMLEALSRNFNFRNEKAALYEIATVYIKNEDEDSLPTEKQVVTIGLYDNEADFFVLKGIVEAVLTSLNIENYEFVTFANDPSFHKTRTAKVLKDGREIGILGQISPYVEKNYELCRTYCAMLDLNTLIELMGEEKQYRQLPKYPATKRDLALICDEDLAVGEIVKTIKSACGGLLEEVKLFDVYKGKQIADGKKSVAYSITLRAKDRTLEDAEVNKTVEKLFRMLEKINVFLRS